MKHTRIIAGIVLVALLLTDVQVKVHASTFDSLTSTTFDTVDDAGYGETGYAIRFGSTLQEELVFDTIRGSFTFSDDLRVLGSISGSSLNIDRNATVGGSLTVTGSVVAMNMLSGRLLTISGNASFSGQVLLKRGVQGTLSGNALRISAGGADIQGVLNASGSIRTDADLTLGADDAATDVTLTFMNSGTDGTLTWVDAENQFQFTQGVSVLGTISGSSLNVDRNATVGGRLTVTGSVVAMNMLSGRLLTVSGNASLSGSLTVVRGITGANLEVTGVSSGTNLFATRSITGTHLSVTSTFAGSGLTDCDTGATSKLLWDASTKRFSCGTDQTGGSSGGLDYATASGIFLKRGGGTMTGALTLTMSTGALTTSSGVTIDVAENVNDFAVQGAVMYVASTDSVGNDIRIFDVRNPAVPATMGGIDLSTGAEEIEVIGRYLYVGTSATNEFMIYDISRPSSAVLLSSLNIHANTVTAMTVQGRFAYLTDNAGDLNIVDISDPRLPKRIGTLDIGTEPIKDIQVRDRIAYLAIDERSGPTIVDLSNPNAPKLLFGASPIAGTIYGNIRISGRYAYLTYNLLTDDQALAVYNISDPLNPVQLAQLTWVASGVVGPSLAVAGKYAYVGDFGGSMRVIDISNPVSPRFRVTKSFGTATITGVQVHGNHLYLGTENNATGPDVWFINLPGLETAAATIGSLLSNLLDVTDSATIGNSLSVAGHAEFGMGIHATGFSSFTASSGAYAMRITQQSSRTGALAITAHGGASAPHLVFGSGAAFDTNLFRNAPGVLKTTGSFFVSGNISGATLQILGTASGRNLFALSSITGSHLNASSTFAGAGLTDCDTAGTSKLLWDASTKRFSCGTDQTGGSSGGLDFATASGIFVKRSGGTMTGSLTINFATGSTTTLSGANLNSGVLSMDFQGGYAYVGLVSNGGTDLRIFDIRNPGFPTLAGGIELGVDVNEVIIAGKYLYIGLATAGGNDFVIYDVSRPSTPVLQGGVELAGSVHSLHVAGRYAYVPAGGASSTLNIIDVSDPKLPKVVGTYSPGTLMNDIYVRDGHAYVGLPGYPQTHVISVKNPNQPRIVTTLGAVTDPGPVELDVSGRYAYLAIDDSIGFATFALQISDISNPAAPVNLDSWSFGARVTSISVAGQYAAVSLISGEVHILDISNPHDIRYRMKFTAANQVNRVRFHGKQLYLGLASVAGLDFVIMNMAGVDSTLATFGSTVTNLLSVSDNAWFGNDVSVLGAIEAGQGIQATGFSTFTSGSGNYAMRIVQQTSRTGALAITAHGGVSAPHLVFGSGAAFDTNLFRNSPGVLKTSGSFFVSGNISGATLQILGTASGRNLFALSSITGSHINASSTFAGAGLTDCDTAGTSKLLWDASTKRFSCGTDQTGGSSGGGMSYETASGIFLKRSGGVMTGGLVIRATTADVVKTTSGSSLSTDFSVAGSTLLNVISNDDTLTIASGAVPNGGLGEVVNTSIPAAAAVGAGAFSILRTDGQIITVHGNSSTTGSQWDGIAGSMTSRTITASAVNVGAGAIGLSRLDGRWLIVHGGTLATSSIFDPYNVTAPTAGPALTSCTATTGTNAFQTGSGTYVIICGGSANWGVYYSRSNVYTAGTALGTGTFGAGAHALQRDDGTFLVMMGNNSSNHYIYTPWGSPTGLWSTANPIPNPPTVTTGGFSIRRADGKFLIVPGGITSSSIYDPRTTSTGVPGTFTAQSGAGYGPSAALGDGAGAIWRPDGKYFLTLGGGTVTNIIDPGANGGAQFTLGPALGTAAGAGSHMVIGGSGSVRVFAGGASTTTMNYKMGFIVGGPSTSTGSIYESECITTTSLHSGSTLSWNASSDDFMTFQVRTGNGSCPAGVTGYKTIANKGDLINPTSGHNRVQMRVIFRRTMPRFADQEWGLRRGLSQTRYRRVNKDPTLYDIAVENTSMLRRTQFEFGNSNDASGPVMVNIANDRNRNLQIQLISLSMYSSTQNINTTAGHTAEGTFTRHNSLSVAAGIGTIVMKKPDGKFVVISGRAAPNAQLYDQNSQTFSLMSVSPGFSTGTGALAFKRPDGKFLIVGGAGMSRTSVYDPFSNSFTNGPRLTGIVGEGSFPIPLPNGRVLIAHGGFQKTSSIYDPYQNIFLTGSLLVSNIGRGSTAIPRHDGTWMITHGTTNNTCTPGTTTSLFDPYAVKSYPNTGVAHTTGVGPGSVAFQRNDGRWMIVHGVGTAGCKLGTNRTSLYSPQNNRIVAGGATSRFVGLGAMVLPRPDGLPLIIHGSGSTLSQTPLSTSIFQETGGAFTTEGGATVGSSIIGPSMIHPVGTGALAFQRDDGQFVVISGQTSPVATASGAVQLYDAGWVANGFYRTENMYIPDLDSASTLSWKATEYGSVSAEVRTATASTLLQTKEDRSIAAPGGKINPLSTPQQERWLQVEFSLKRTFPSYGGIWEDVWYNGGRAPTVPLRTIATPTISEFSVNKDKDLVDLQADRLSVFRVSSNGDIYSGNKGSINTGGADLAERYTSVDDLKPGELVSIDYTSEDGVRRSKGEYQWDLLGVVSTSPGFVAGAFTQGSHPIALVGRVPVLVTLEHGDIMIGDRLTSSSISGTAMKATKAGRVVGMALSSVDKASIGPCPRDEKKQCGRVMMFVNLSDWPGPQ
ncbi:MAG: hypothetical protein ABL890_01515 [Candidatus Peribacteraceae bacterium]